MSEPARVFDPDSMASAFRDRPLGALRLLLEAAEAGHIQIVSGHAEGDSLKNIWRRLYLGPDLPLLRLSAAS